MVAKIFFAIGLAAGVALIVQAQIDSRREARTLKKETKQSAVTIANLVVGAVEQTMLEGDGLKVESLIERLKGNMPDAEVHVYDQRGIEVFAPKSAKPDMKDVPPHVAGVLSDHTRSVTDDGRIVRPVPNEERCGDCHDADDALRGVIELDIDRKSCANRRDALFTEILGDGFVHVMTVDEDDVESRIRGYFEELVTSSTAIRNVVVYDEIGNNWFADSIEGVDDDTLEPLLSREAKPRYVPHDGGTLALVPMFMEQRCTACHEEDLGELRGVLAVSLAAPPAADECSEENLEVIVDRSLRNIMLSALGRRVADFLDEVASTDAVRELVLWDHEGRKYWTTTHPDPPPHVAEVLASMRAKDELLGSGEGQRVRVVQPLDNDEGCMRCHGSGSELRGAVTVGLSTKSAVLARRASLRSRYKGTAITLLGILIILWALLQLLVARPVRQIGDVAEAVGRGDLGLTVAGARENGDEMARLGQRINEMVRGLRAKIHLEKFVSKGASAAAADAGLEEISRTGERRPVTVLFSDIRGFTAYSENVDPEEVVAMLNRLLQAQAEVVTKHGGDIDKFVGDELMAVFQGEDACERAVLCAAEMIQAVHDVRKTELSVGVGISTGDVVYGAIGHEKRMDFTVIGDVVNTGARLCSAASGDEVVVTEAVRDQCGDLDDLEFREGEPLNVKGKRDSLRVFLVDRG
jgi:adenylate cyclase